MFHRVIPDFMVQGGCPQGTGTGGPGYKFEDEATTACATARHAVDGQRRPEHQRQPVLHHPRAAGWLDGKHTVFGNVIEGQDVVDAIKQGDKIKSLKIEGDAAACWPPRPTASPNGTACWPPESASAAVIGPGPRGQRRPRSLIR